MTIWGTLYSYLFGSDIQNIYKEADGIYQESKKLQESWVLLSKAPEEEPLDQASKDITASELQILTEALGEGADKKLINPLYDSFISHVNQEIDVLEKTIHLMDRKFDDLPQLESIQASMRSVIAKLKAKQRDLIEFKGRIILLAKVNSEMKSQLQHKIIRVELDMLERPARLPPTPPVMPFYQISPPVSIMKQRAKRDNVHISSSPHATMIELLRKGVKLRKVKSAEQRSQKQNEVHKKILYAITFKQFSLRSVKEVPPLPKILDMQTQLCLELKDKKLTVGSLRQVSASAPVRTSFKPDSLQSQMESILSARRAQLQDSNLGESENDAEWDSQVQFRPIRVLDQTSSEDASESSSSFNTSDMEEGSSYAYHHNTPIMSRSYDKENGRVPMMFKMSEDESSSDVYTRGFMGLPSRACSQEEDLRAGTVLNTARQVPQSV
ncbi:MAG: hypothetical protein KBF71_05260 [Alphaproteobacteria bacterium]|jgi:hypothetical protein|nr:hypothetical protein [Alphaproteobacteria bacterium]